MTYSLFSPPPSKKDTRKPTRSQNRDGRTNFATWTRAELVIADYLIEWALTRITEPGRVENFVRYRARLFQERLKRDRQIVERFMNHQPPPPHEDGVRLVRFNAILRQIEDRTPF